MSSQSARRRAAAARSREAARARKADPVADRAAAAAAIYAQYAESVDAVHEEEASLIRQVRAIADRKLEEAWAERCRKLGELEDRKIPAEASSSGVIIDAAAIQALKDAGTDRLTADLEGRSELLAAAEHGPIPLEAAGELELERQADEEPEWDSQDSAAWHEAHPAEEDK